MKAWLVETITAQGQMRLADVPEPVAAPGQYVIEVEAAGLNFLDALMLRGMYQVKPALPFTPGIEAVGRIIAANDAPLPVGARVVATLQGAYAERAVVDATAAAEIPDDVPAADAISLLGIVHTTSWHALHNRAALRAGETVLVHAAAGGVGSAAVQIAVAAGARVIATAGGAEKVATALKLGAEAAIDYGAEDWLEAVRGLTGGRGADVIYDPVGGEVGERSLRCLAWHGRYLVVGFAAGPIPSLAANRLLLKETSAMGVYWGGASAADPALAPRVRAAVLALYRAGKLQPLIGGRYPLERADAALASLAGRGSIGKIVLTRP
jgi:NADPH2:quinone reductase